MFGDEGIRKLDMFSTIKLKNNKNKKSQKSLT